MELSFQGGSKRRARPDALGFADALLMEPEIARTLKRRRRTPGLSVAKFSGGDGQSKKDFKREKYGKQNNYGHGRGLGGSGGRGGGGGRALASSTPA